MAADPGKLYVVNVDNDNVLTGAWVQDAQRAAAVQAPVVSRFSKTTAVFTHWNTKSPGCYGRIGAVAAPREVGAVCGSRLHGLA